MPTHKLSTLLQDLIQIPEPLDCPITGLTLDSRQVTPGDLFFACPGFYNNGNTYIEQAMQQGAAAIITEAAIPTCQKQNHIPVIAMPHVHQHISQIAARFYNYPAKKLRIVGVTGTNGKTSCSHFVAASLQRMGIPCGIIGTLGAGTYGQLKSTGFTTPDAISLQKLFAEFVEQGLQAVVMEVSSHSLDQGRSASVPFEVAIFTNLTRDHLDYHGNMETYGAAKRRLFDSPLTQYAVINADDPFGLEMIQSLHENRSIYAYTVQATASLPVPVIIADQIKLDITGLSAHVKTPWGEGRLQTRLIGQFNLSNVLSVLTALCLTKIPFQDALTCISHLNSVPGRMETFGGGNKPLVVVDYAHTPDSLEKVLLALREHCEGELYCLFGCGGNRDKGKRPIMASIAERHADKVMVTDDNPRHESSTDIAADIMQGFQHPDQIIIELDRTKAIQQIIKSAKPGDCVLIAGRGGETHQQIGDSKIPFNDAEKVAQLMESTN